MAKYCEYCTSLLYTMYVRQDKKWVKTSKYKFCQECNKAFNVEFKEVKL